MTQLNKPYDLDERTAIFSERIIAFCKKVKLGPVSRNLIDQLVRSATSIGANYMEATGASSKKDFRNKIHICKKEAQETQYWLRLMNTALPERKPELRLLWKEAHELVLIFNKIGSSLKN